MSRQTSKQMAKEICHDIMKNRRHNLCRDRIFLCHDTDYCNMEKLIGTEKELQRKTSVAIR